MDAASLETVIPPVADVRNKLLKMLVEPLPMSAAPNTLPTLLDEGRLTSFKNPPPNGVEAENENPAAVAVVTPEVVIDGAAVVTCMVCQKKKKV